MVSVVVVVVADDVADDDGDNDGDDETWGSNLGVKLRQSAVLGRLMWYSGRYLSRNIGIFYAAISVGFLLGIPISVFMGFNIMVQLQGVP